MSNLPPSGEIPRGAIRFNTDSNKPELWDGSQWAEFQLSTPNLGQGSDTQPGARGLFAGGYSPTSPSQSNVIGYINIDSTGDAVDFGDLTVARIALGGLASRTRGVFGGGLVTPANQDTIDFVTISSTGDATDFGNLTVARHWVQPGSSSTRGLFAAGNAAGGHVNTIDYITIASTGNAVDFGDISYRASITSGSSCSSPTRTIFGGGTVPGGSLQNNIEFVTTATLGNAQDFGDFTIGRGREGRCSNATRGVFGGNSGPSNTIDYITIATLGNAINFGDLTTARENLTGCSSPTRGVFGGGQTPTNLNTIDYVQIMTTGDAVDFGDMTIVSNHLAGCSNAHGGL
ncbi:MAG: hypothetical protein ACXADH_16820 [Candidatus Kariarchaeaceae archaeon]|jgi:hypothetical protein